MKNELRELAYELDHEVGSCALRVYILNDIKTKFNHLNDSMESAKHRGDQQAYFEEHFMEVRVLSELMFFVMEHLNGEFEKVEKLKEQLFKKIVQELPENKEAHTTANSESSNKRH